MESAIAAFLIAVSWSPQDMAMQVAQEGTLIGWREATMEPRVSGLIEDLGDPCFKCYTRAMAPARRLFVAEPRWIAWAMRHRDPAVRFRAGSLVPRCPLCRGSGERDIPYDSDQNWPNSRCLHCRRPRAEHRESETEFYTVYCDRPCAPCGGTGLGWGGPSW